MARPVTPGRARAVAGAAATRLAALVGADGRFVYRYALNDPAFTSSLYGPVRHIGAVWALADAGRDIAGLEDAAARAAHFMETQLFRPYGGTDSLCVLDEGFIKLSGSALGVAAEAALAAIGGTDRADRIAGLARYVASQREADGDFLPARVPGPLARPHPARDDLTAGQAVLALTLAARATGEGAWLAAATHSADRFAARDSLVGRLAHWMLYALEALDRAAPDDSRLAYAGRLAAGIAALPPADDSIPIACASEGLLAYARTLQRRGGHEAEVAALLVEVEQNLRRQLRFFHPSGAFVMSAARHEVRIDTIMHNLLGFLGWARIMEERE